MMATGTMESANDGRRGWIILAGFGGFVAVGIFATVMSMFRWNKAWWIVGLAASLIPVVWIAYVDFVR
jgi:hypothetical protein